VDFNFSEEETMLRDGVSRFVAAEYELPKRQALIAAGRDHWARFAELGWLGVSIPEEAGGYGASPTGAMLVSEILGGGLAVEPYLGAAVLAPQAILAALGAEGGAALLTPVVEGSAQIALANSEYEARGKLSFVATTATRKGDKFIIDGKKTAIIGGSSATTFLVAARTAGKTDDSQGITLFRVAPDAPGLTLRHYHMIDGTRMSDLTLQGVEVSADAIVGKDGGAFAALDAGTDAAIIAACFGVVGAMSASLSLTTEYLGTRKQFGQALKEFQVLRHRAADMLVALEQARSAAYRGLAGLHQQDPQARAHAASAAKIVVAQSSRFVCGQSIQLHGGMGVTEEFRISHLFKYAAVANALFGSDSYHIERLGALM
jgi:alkylation response protein AidB-like acyl-CoA dehydrogenase